MSIISVEGLKKAFGEKKILSDATFGLEEGEKAGVIGINGTGKSTLLKMIAGEEESDDGKIIKANKARVAYLPQIPDFNSDKTIIEFKLASNSKLKQNLQNQVDVYKKANNTNKSITVLFFFNEKERNKLERVLRELQIKKQENIEIIDCTKQKPSASNVKG